MKINISCFECFEEGVKSDGAKRVPYVPTYPYWEYATIELDKWPYIEFTCEKGHITRLTLGFELYELLFQQATYCIMDGYYREAISTYNTALERFFEYAIEIMVLSNSQDFDYNKLWKSVKKQSERQLGAFYFLFATHFNELPTFLDEDKVKLRNQVVHQGELATRLEAEEFGEYVFNFITNTRKKLEEKYGDELYKLNSLRLSRNCIQSYKTAQKHTNKLDINENEQNIRNTSCNGPCFLNMESIKTYPDCFKPENQLDYGLQK